MPRSPQACKEPPHSPPGSGTGPRSVQRFCAWAGLPSVYQNQGCGRSPGSRAGPRASTRAHSEGSDPPVCAHLRRRQTPPAGDAPRRSLRQFAVKRRPSTLSSSMPREVAHATPPARCRCCVARTLSVPAFAGPGTSSWTGAGNERGVLGLFSWQRGRARARPALRSALKRR